jgi:spermidine synthase
MTLPGIDPMPIDEQHWFTEVFNDAGSAFSLRIKEKLHEEQTPYQKIEIFKTEAFGMLMVIDGFIMLSSRDNFLYHEMLSHPVLFTHPAPRKVLIIGGGDCGTLREVLRHPDIEQVQQVDIDEQVTRLSERYFPELCEANNDARAELHFADGIKWVREADDNRYDVIIVDSTDPVGPGEVLFTHEFYLHCRRILGNDGLLVQQSESPMYHLDLLTRMHQIMRAAGFVRTQTLTFPQPVYPSGWWSATLAGNTDLTAFRQRDVETRPFPTRYYNHRIHQASLALPGFVEQHLQENL